MSTDAILPKRDFFFNIVISHTDRVVAAALSMSVEKLQAMKATLRGKIKDHFTD